MKRIRIRYDAESDTYKYKCPFCNQVTLVGGRSVSDINVCEHVIFSYEDVSNQALGDFPELFNIVYPILKEKPITFIPEFQDIFESEYMPDEETMQKEPDAYGQAWDEAFAEYFDNGFSLEDLIKTIQHSHLKNWLPNIVIAETEEDVEGWGKTYYVLHKNKGENLKDI